MRKNHFCLIIVAFLTCYSVAAQDTTTADGLFAVARKAAFDEKDYDRAIHYAWKALEINPKYGDIIVFTGRVYTWKKWPDSARAYFESALDINPPLVDAYAAYADMEYWNDNHEKAVRLLDRGLSVFPGSVPLLIRKAKVLAVQREYQQAIIVADSILSIDRKNTEARALASQIRDNISKNRVGIKYDYIHFDKQFPDPWQLISVDYTRQTKAGPFTARVNYANRFKTDGLQYELEAYPQFSKTFYGYLNLGYSDDVGVFPRWRAGASLYANLPKAFETELGVRYLYFNSDAFIYTAYLGKYYSSFLFGARAYLSPVANNMTQSYMVMARYYYGGIDNYVGIMAGAGLSPDDRRINVLLNNSANLRSYTGELTVRHAIRRLNIITLNASLLNTEYLSGVTGNQLQVGIGYIRRF